MHVNLLSTTMTKHFVKKFRESRYPRDTTKKSPCWPRNHDNGGSQTRSHTSSNFDFFDLRFAKFTCVLWSWFVFRKTDLCFGILICFRIRICVFVNWFVFDTYGQPYNPILQVFVPTEHNSKPLDIIWARAVFPSLSVCLFTATLSCLTPMAVEQFEFRGGRSKCSRNDRILLDHGLKSTKFWGALLF